jgi:hypothetical protein
MSPKKQPTAAKRARAAAREGGKYTTALRTEMHESVTDTDARESRRIAAKRSTFDISGIGGLPSRCADAPTIRGGSETREHRIHPIEVGPEIPTKPQANTHPNPARPSARPSAATPSRQQSLAIVAKLPATRGAARALSYTG